ncbi:hypothetical protein BpHYR1_026693 [Brachionus plicatilis]|uniref:Uncharacterized protein n=1 Tax=Brachionus plicatilis TaxID=10195 RepID=A0A3M7R5C4_BRAPC|nr:hypothetical protein BpHYR1_026693 [Brachionus plicatilis]
MDFDFFLDVCQLPRRKSFQALEDSDPSKMFPQHENFRLKLYLIELAEHLMLAFEDSLKESLTKILKYLNYNGERNLILIKNIIKLTKNNRLAGIEEEDEEEELIQPPTKRINRASSQNVAHEKVTCKTCGGELKKRNIFIVLTNNLFNYSQKATFVRDASFSRLQVLNLLSIEPRHNETL